MDTGWSRGVWTALLELRDRLAAIVPGLALMVTLIALGLALGWLVRLVLARLGRAVGLDDQMERWGVAASLRRAGILRTPADVLGLLAFWAVFILFASLGVDRLAGAQGGTATAFVFSLVPPLFAALLILIAGWLVANFLSQGLLIAAVNAGLPEARLLARAAHWGVLLFAGATALTHLGIGKEMVLVAFGITFGGLVFALALAFGLGGRHIARELLARRLRREAPPERERLTHL
ncbi:MAG: mechanosensitive ion channel family protein [Candidatus Rokuibacteriota bacterium]